MESDDILELMSKMNLGTKNENATKLIEEIENKLNFKFPIQYKEFMLRYNGAEGELGENNYLVLWPLEEIVSLNEGYEVSKYTPDFIYFGSDGGGMAYAFDKRTTPISYIELPFESIEDVNTISNSFNSFIRSLYEY